MHRRAIPASSIRATAFEPARCLRAHRRLGGGVKVKNILLVAAREFRQIAGMRSFWLTLIIIPLSMVIGGLAPQLIDKDEAARVMVIDRTGGSEAAAIAQRIELDRDRDMLGEL